MKLGKSSECEQHQKNVAENPLLPVFAKEKHKPQGTTSFKSGKEDRLPFLKSDFQVLSHFQDKPKRSGHDLPSLTQTLRKVVL